MSNSSLCCKRRRLLPELLLLLPASNDLELAGTESELLELGGADSELSGETVPVIVITPAEKDELLSGALVSCSVELPEFVELSLPLVVLLSSAVVVSAKVLLPTASVVLAALVLLSESEISGSGTGVPSGFEMVKTHLPAGVPVILPVTAAMVDW